ncbi:MAG: type I restriction enzyme HsdR N-terminal domain-containing protein [Bacteroidetes bacterium]|nr:type I restriction enzyme HsdR N-terminal domain-containing protein [Bacteroidota bacterium]HET6245250.1 type I restriction enzyme HsdR N-terminal domain-containing protein [Bacteroidia bacterium]
MIELNLPVYDYKIKKDGQRSQIFDKIRKKFVVLTPEEWVRQHFINFLSIEKNYPLSLMKIEKGLKYNNQIKRTDIVIYNNMGLPSVIVECKAPEVKINAAVFEQIARYNMQLKVDILIVTNGMDHYCCYIDYTTNSFTFIKEIPGYNENFKLGI